MTLIQCFNHSLIENVAVCLRLQPDKLILLGNGEEASVAAGCYEKVFALRKLTVPIAYLDNREKSLKTLTADLSATLETEASCVIDLTNGDETELLAMGGALAGFSKKTDICVIKYDAPEDKITCLHGQPRIAAPTAELSVHELVLLHGGVVHPNSYQPPKEFTISDLNPLWSLVCKDPKEWNHTLAVLAEFESRSKSKTEIDLSVSKLSSDIQDFGTKEQTIRELLEALHNRGIIHNQSSHSRLRYTYTSPVYRYCMQKAGNMLEMKVLLESRKIRLDGKPYFTDCLTSVSIDWDGLPHRADENTPDTRNEVDVVLVHGLTPLFISCKNGSVDDEELYKLYTVAQRFGGPRARKMLVLTDLDRGSPKADLSYTQRARDMGIHLVAEGAALKDSASWQEHILKALK